MKPASKPVEPPRVPSWLAALALGGYSWFMRALQPWAKRRLLRRGRSEPGYLEDMPARFGQYRTSAYKGPRSLDLPPSTSTMPLGLVVQSMALSGSPVVWVHAVSLGETRAAEVLLQSLRRQWPGMRLVLTHGTATGRSAGGPLLRPGDEQTWLPWDTPEAVARFLDHARPDLGVLMETEVWPNLVAQCRRRGVPLVLANARLNEHSAQRAQRLSWLARPAYAGLALALAQTSADAQRLQNLGARVASVTGNLKYDLMPDGGQLVAGRQWGRLWRQHSGRPVAMLASAREGEEHMLLEALSRHEAALRGPQAVQWLIVPRHPQRFDEVALLIERSGRRVCRLSHMREQGVLPPTEAPTQRQGPADWVWLGDSMGEMPFYYGLADIALLGGSFAPLGGQNLIEAAACGCPVVMGPHTFNFAEAAELAEAAGAALRSADLAAAVLAASNLARQPSLLRRAHRAAEAYVGSQRGAAERTVQACARLLAERPLKAPPAR